MQKRLIIFSFILLFFTVSLLANNQLFIYQKNSPVQQKTLLDSILINSWKKENLALPFEATDAIFLRRAYLNLTGRRPTIDKVKSYINDRDPDKADKLIDQLVDSPEFNEFWTMYFQDYLRVKSEFPINLWPNAVYAYSRRIQSFLENNEPYDKFIYSLLLGKGSNFREAEANFYRALSRKNSEGISDMVATTLMGVEFKSLSQAQQDSLISFFDCVKYKYTKEWKEEIVYIARPTETMTLTLPNGESVIIQADTDPRLEFAKYILAKDNPYFAKALVNWVWFKFFGSNFSENPNDLTTEIHSEQLLNHLANSFTNSGYDFKKLCRTIAKSVAFKSSAFAVNNQEKSELFFNAYRMQRLDAEVIDDVVNDITNSISLYESVIPEPFTYLPNQSRTISIADGSITSSFLIIFGRSVRDTGKVEDRNNFITSKQRQQLFNSSDFYRKISQLAWGKQIRNLKLNMFQRVDYYYLLILSRYPSQYEHDKAIAYIKKNPKNWINLIWILFNTQEFLYKN